VHFENREPTRRYKRVTLFRFSAIVMLDRHSARRRACRKYLMIHQYRAGGHDCDNRRITDHPGWHKLAMVIAWIEQKHQPHTRAEVSYLPSERRGQIGNIQFTNFVSAGQAQV
jgi:hypothetical protein